MTRKQAILIVPLLLAAAAALVYWIGGGEASPETGGPPEPVAGGSGPAARKPALETRAPSGEEPPSGEPEESASGKPAGGPKVEVLSRRKLLSGPIPFMAPRFAADGEHVLVTGENYRGLWVARRDGGGLRQISEAHMAGWRPVSTRSGELLYRTAQLDERGNVSGFTIHLHDLESGREEELYHGPGEDVYPPWVSGDEELALILSDGELKARSLGGGEVEAMLEGREEGIAYSEDGQVWYRRVGSGESLPVSTETQATGGEVLSPEGEHVAYLSGNTGSARIVDMSTGEETDIGSGSNLSWSPDGSLLLYDVVEDDGHNIVDSKVYVVGPGGGEPQQVTLGEEGAFHNPSWSPEGDAFVAEDVHTGEIYEFRVNVTTAN